MSKVVEIAVPMSLLGGEIPPSMPQGSSITMKFVGVSIAEVPGHGQVLVLSLEDESGEFEAKQ